MDDSSETSSNNELNIKIETRVEKTRIDTPLPQYLELNLGLYDLYHEFKRYLLDLDQLKKYKFPRESPDHPGRIIIDPRLVRGSIQRMCQRCGESFCVLADGQYKAESYCRYHALKWLTYREDHPNSGRFPCCNGNYMSEGCASWQYHVSTESFLHDIEFIKAGSSLNEFTASAVYAVDCEMVFTTAGMEVAKVGIVGVDGLTVYESFVLPENPVLDYNTRYSGVTEKDLKCLQTTLVDVQAFLLKLLNKDSILVGHGLENDLKALRIIHERVVDTSVTFLPVGSKVYKKSLKVLAKEFLNKDIQESVNGHDSIEDARTCMELMLLQINTDLKNRISFMQVEDRITLPSFVLCNSPMQTYFSYNSSSNNESNIKIETRVEKTRIDSPLPQYLELNLGLYDLYHEFERYLLDLDQLKKYKFPRESPDHPGRIIIDPRLVRGSTQRICQWCGEFFSVLADGQYKAKRYCRYHTSQPLPYHKEDPYSGIFPCCNGNCMSAGCVSWQYHVSTERFLHDIEFVKAGSSKHLNEFTASVVYAVDCEMVFTTAGMEVAKIGIVGVDGLTVYESFVLPENPVLDYNTSYSGITENDLKGVRTTLGDVQAFLLKRLNKDSILVGHRLDNELNALRIIHEKVVDISVTFLAVDSNVYEKSLKVLAKKFLNKNLQESVNGHDCIEDARTCMELMLLQINTDLKNRISFMQDEDSSSNNESNIKIETRVEKTRIDSPLPQYLELNLGLYDLYHEFERYLLDLDQLKKYKFPRESPDHPGRIIIDPRLVRGSTQRICQRCGESFSVLADGQYKAKRYCRYHTSQPLPYHKEDPYSGIFPCCNGNCMSAGCVSWQYHVSTERFLHDIEFVKAGSSKHLNEFTASVVYAVDCEMVFTTAGMEVAKIGIVGVDGLTVYESFVLPENPVLDYNTSYSGITENDLKGVRTTLGDVQAFLLKRLNKDSILVGHRLDNELNALRIIHEKVVDISVTFPAVDSNVYEKSLKVLAKTFLNKNIQESVNGHDCIEDARTCMELMLLQINTDLKNRISFMQDEDSSSNNDSYSQLEKSIVLSQYLELNLGPYDLYKSLIPYLLEVYQLKMYEFPCESPDHPGCINPVPNLVRDSTQRLCCRCGKSFCILADGRYEADSCCRYHPYEENSYRFNHPYSMSFPCCFGNFGSEGCESWPYHVSAESFLHNIEFVNTSSKQDHNEITAPTIYAMDCELLFTTAGMEVGKVAIVGVDGMTVYESFVLPQNPILDYNTRYSGISVMNFKDVETTLFDVQAFLLNLLTKNSIVVGHELEKAFKALRLIHENIIDTSLVFPLHFLTVYKKPLKTLAKEVLNKHIQDSLNSDHCIENARTCMELMLLKISTDKEKRLPFTQNENIFPSLFFPYTSIEDYDSSDFSD